MHTSHLRDDLDREIIFHLQENARLSTSYIAKKLNVARSTVYERITRLEREGVIEGYTAIIKQDPRTRPVSALVSLELKRNYLSQIITDLQRYPEVKSCSAITGSFDLFCTVEAPLLEDIDALLEEISDLPYITRISSNVILANKFDRTGTTPNNTKQPYLRAVGA
ncbi:Lrp/AsnC family transcriptional regulator [Kiloniella sp.]|uniref:Lrp/AsnC family transcriptional regulator n=1 Tax=Kiloniella sp. TaxID=1938587 RepID=UPI003A93B74F